MRRRDRLSLLSFPAHREEDAAAISLANEAKQEMIGRRETDTCRRGTATTHVHT